ncbi:hypothetical protein BHE74_00005630 [Ensete ventricosum]|nr:hypothetical protein GW17_00012252 [Ensete ventricosum]RWW85674.1 hypothetical protein BHE74_00005630 [Ensete ventricosum]RZS10035.1 hypothetical protein BHM03_00041171 [Ensete ventricosum]
MSVRNDTANLPHRASPLRRLPRTLGRGREIALGVEPGGRMLRATTVDCKGEGEGKSLGEGAEEGLESTLVATGEKSL